IKKIVLLDVHAILHRAYHALPGFASSKGEPTGGLYGVSAFVIKILGELQPDYIIACYDLPTLTFRKKLYADYKAGRKKPDEELVAQMIRSRDIFKAFNIPIYEKPGFEADDMLGTIAEKVKTRLSGGPAGEAGNMQVIIASGDLDTLQLVDGEKVVVYTLKKGLNDTIIYNEKAVVERFGFTPKYMADYKGLRGDPSDNIIGIKGIGEKSAEELIKNFGHIEEIYKQIKKDPEKLTEAGIKTRIIELLKSGEEEALFSKMLATIRLDVPIDFSIPESPLREAIDIEKVKKLFQELEFRTLGPRLEALLKSGKGGSEEKNEVVPPVGGPTSFFSFETADPKLFKELAIA
ncbi:MAG: 5'-3' exonuclease H3TH domain-containing protein, partial [Patescibacteria group bacterium]